MYPMFSNKKFIIILFIAICLIYYLTQSKIFGKYIVHIVLNLIIYYKQYK